jgi:hypothetical protein
MEAYRSTDGTPEVCLNKDLSYGKDKSHKREVWREKDAAVIELYRHLSALLYFATYKIHYK